MSRPTLISQTPGNWNRRDPADLHVVTVTLPEDGEPVDVYLTHRPARILALVHTSPGGPLAALGPLALMEAALADLSCTWGSAGHSVLPVPTGSPDGDRLFWALARLLDPDSVTVARPTGADLIYLDRARAIEALEARELTIPAGPARERDRTDWLHRPLLDLPLPDGVREALLDRLSPLHLDRDLLTLESAGGLRPLALALEDLAGVSHLLAPTGGREPWQRLALTRALGRLTDRADVALMRGGVRVEHAELDHSQLVAAAHRTRIGPDPFPAQLTARRLVRRRRRPGMLPTPTLVYGSGEWDAALYLGLRAVGQDAWWLPADALRDDAYCQRLAERLASVAHERQLAAWAVTVSATREDFVGPVRERLARLIGYPLALERVEWEQVIPEDPYRLVVDGQHDLPITVQMHRGRTTALGVGRLDDAVTSERARPCFMIDANVEGWTPVAHPALGEPLVTDPNNGPHLRRAGSDGLSFFGPISLEWPGEVGRSRPTRPHIHVSSLYEQLALVCAASGWRLESSDKGNYTRHATELFGGVDALLQTLQDPVLERILMAYLGDADQTFGLRLAGRLHPSLAQLRALHTHDVEDRIRELLDRTVLQPGLVLKCARCRQATWCPLRRLERHFECERCGQEQPIDASHWVGDNDPRWYYRLDEALLQFFRHDGDLPLIAAASLPVRPAWPTQQAFELALTGPDGTLSELDVAISHGSTLTIGEATSSAHLAASADKETRRLQRLRDVARLLGAKRVLLATSAPQWKHGTRKRACAMFADQPADLKFMENVSRPARTAARAADFDA